MYGRAPRGQRLIADAPFGQWKTQTFIAGLRYDRMVAPWVFDGAMNQEAFVTYIQTQLAPTLKPKDVVIMDNLSSHKSHQAHAIIRQTGAWSLFLPPYSPDWNPIEMAFSKLKAWVRRAKARTLTDLWQTIGDVCDLFSEQECRNYFFAAGYEPA